MQAALLYSQQSSGAVGVLDALDDGDLTCFEEIRPLEAAQILTVIEWRFFRLIDLQEFTKKRFSSRPKSPSLHRSIDRFNTVTMWIVTMVLKTDVLATR